MDITTYLANSMFFILGNAIWEWMTGMTFGVLTMTPDAFSGGAWGYITGSAYPLTLSVGVVFLNLAFLAGIFRQASNLRQNFTFEILLELGIKLLFANLLMQAGIPIMQGLFRSAAGLAGAVGDVSSFTAVPDDIDAGLTIFGCIFGILYFLVSAVCGVMIFLAVYGRFLSLYVMVACAPLALPFLAGGQGMERTGGAFIRTFLGKCFEIIAIALFLGVGERLCQGIDWGRADGAAGWFDGAGQCLQNMVTMILLTASVKGADAFMRKVFGL